MTYMNDIDNDKHSDNNMIINNGSMNIITFLTSVPVGLYVNDYCIFLCKTEKKDNILDHFSSSQPRQ